MAAQDSIHVIRQLRQALILGLQSTSELDRLDDAWGKHVDICGKEIPDDLRPITSGMVGDFAIFADAFSYLENLERSIDEGKVDLLA
jgi:hypothetical protein